MIYWLDKPVISYLFTGYLQNINMFEPEYMALYLNSKIVQTDSRKQNQISPQNLDLFHFLDSNYNIKIPLNSKIATEEAIRLATGDCNRSSSSKSSSRRFGGCLMLPLVSIVVLLPVSPQTPLGSPALEPLIQCDTK